MLASEVQVTHPDDRDRVRLTLTGEAGLNDGTAFPFVLLGLALIGSSRARRLRLEMAAEGRLVGFGRLAWRQAGPWGESVGRLVV